MISEKLAIAEIGLLKATLDQATTLIGDMQAELTATRQRAIEDCAQVADAYARDGLIRTELPYRVAADIAADIRAIAPPRAPRNCDPNDFPWWAFV